MTTTKRVNMENRSIINSCLRLVPLQELKEEDRQKLIATYGYPYELQHKDTSETLKNSLGMDIPVEPSVIDSQHPLHTLPKETTEKDHVSTGVNPLSIFESQMSAENRLYHQLSPKEFRRFVNRHRSRIGGRLMTQSQAYGAMRYFEESALRAPGSLQDQFLYSR